MTRKRRAHLLAVFLLTALIFATGRWAWSGWNSPTPSAAGAADYTPEEIAALRKAADDVGFDPECTINTVQVVRRAVREDDAKTLAWLLDYPTIVGLDDGTKMVLDSPRHFVACYHRIATPQFKTAVLGQPASNVYVRAEYGVLLGDWRIWIDDVGVCFIRSNDKSTHTIKFFDKRGRRAARQLEGQALLRAIWRLKDLVFPKERTVDSEGSSVFCRDEYGDPARYSIYLADINNDGRDDYVVVQYSYGSASFSWLHGAWAADTDPPARLPVEEVASRSLDPNTPVEDFAWHHVVSTWIAEPFLLEKNGLTYFGFAGSVFPEYYIWRGDRITRANPMGVHNRRLESLLGKRNISYFRGR